MQKAINSGYTYLDPGLCNTKRNLVGQKRSDQFVSGFLYIFFQKREDIFSTRTKKKVLSQFFFVFKFFAKIQKKHTLKFGEKKTEKQFFYNIAV